MSIVGSSDSPTPRPPANNLTYPRRTLGLAWWFGTRILAVASGLAEATFAAAYPEWSASSSPSLPARPADTSDLTCQNTPQPPSSAYRMTPEHEEAELSQVWFAVHQDHIRQAMVWAAGILDGRPADEDDIEQWLANFEIECRLHDEIPEHPKATDMVLDDDDPSLDPDTEEVTDA